MFDLFILVLSIIGLFYSIAKIGHDEFNGFTAFILLISIIMAIVGYVRVKPDVDRAEENEIERERRNAIDSQNDTSPYRIRYFTEPCPYCHHYKVRISNWDDKKMSVAFWGVWSDKIGKTFHCDHCKRDFNN